MFIVLLDHKHLALRHRFFHLNQSKMFDDIFDKVFKKYVQTDSFRLPMCVKAGHTFKILQNLFPFTFTVDI